MNTHHRQIQIHQLKFMKLTHHHESLIQWDLSVIEQAIRGKNVVIARVAKTKEHETLKEFYDILTKDMSTMFESKR